MRQIVLFACFLAAVGVFAVRFLDAKVQPPKAAVARTADSAASPAVQSGRVVTVRADALGHFQVSARVEGRPIDFMVDSGASYVALRESEAARLGIHPDKRDFTVKVETANGVTRAAPVELDSIDIDGVVVHNVHAIVHPDSGLPVNLLGMSYLSRVRWSHDHGKLELEQ